MLYRMTVKSFVLVCFTLMLASTANAQTDKEKKIEAFKKQLTDVMSGKGDKFEGSKTCMKCHIAPKLGRQYKIWQKGPHAKAYKSLLSEEGKKRAAAKNIEKPEEDKNCLSCHAILTTVPAASVGKKYKPDEGVGCEACHGPGQKHAELASKAMKAKEELSAEARDCMLKVADIDLKKVLCGRCHQKHEWHETSAQDVEKAWEKIAHMKPKK